MKSVIDQTRLPGQEDIDALLGEFFKSEMPEPWPTFQPPRRQSLPFRSRKPRPIVLSSRLALAAAGILLLVCGWLLSGSISPTAYRAPGPVFGMPGEAEKDKMKDLFQPKTPLPRTPGDNKPAIDFMPD